MKQLQNNFTTKEQSKRLLELGVPADSADCYYDNSINPTKVHIKQSKEEYSKHWNCLYTTPCWSVGRLIEIFFKSSKYTYILLYPQFKQMDFLMSLFKEKIKAHKLDFSKLEE